MGIVVCVTLLFGLLALLRDWRGTGKKKRTNGLAGMIYSVAPTLSVVMGLWNILWYGQQHLGSFWGHAALATGVVMLLAGGILLLENNTRKSPVLAAFQRKLSVIRWPVILGLLVGFLLYAVTLIQLNLGYPIIR